MNNATFLYSFLAVLAGVAVPILASINSAFGQTIGNVHWASLTLCVVAFITILVVTISSGVATPSLATFQQASWWHFFGGSFFAVYVVLITFVAPKIGLGNAIIFVVVAQIFTAVTIDHFGLMGAAVQQLDWKRALGIVFLIVGVALARSVPTNAG
ncbi:MAG: DMT family transporter [Hyphomicrobiales bacterium]